ncbi:MAG TPA: ribonuclease P protein component [Candidatus Moranbacteria bacterium]|nr:ribonuclease P protein component [Candidatus Moranbacteria bacterium]
MLPRKNRLTNKKDFEEVHRLGSFFSFGVVFLKVKKNNTGKTRAGFLVGIKFSKKAVERNRIKRQLREIVRKNIGKIKESFDLVISLKKSSKKEILSKDLERDLMSVLEKAKLV